MKKTVVLIATASAALVAVRDVAAIPLPGWVPTNYRRVHSYADATSSAFQYRRLDRRAWIDWQSERTTRRDRRCSATGGGPVTDRADRRIKVPSRVRVYGVTGALIPSLFRGRYIYYRDLGVTRNNDGTGPAKANHEARACSAGRYPIYVHVYADGRNPLGPRALARMIWSTADS
jgi:hypothetical protein